jgi:hypothetical protein
LKVFVQRIADGRFLKMHAVWVESVAEARDFENSTAAIEYCVAQGLEGVRLYVSFSDPKGDFHMDVFEAERKLLEQSGGSQPGTGQRVSEADTVRREGFDAAGARE